MEIGPFRPDGKGSLEWTTQGGAWNEYADVLYLDQPVGTGFSYASTSAYAKSLPQAADEVRYFIERFVEVYPEYAAGNGVDVYIAGESYAGQYIPFEASALTRSPQPVDLRGIALGNGYIDPAAQGGSELEMMIWSGVWKEGGKEWTEANKQWLKCKADLDKLVGSPRDTPACSRMLPTIIDITTQKVAGQSKARCINIYDVRLSDTSPDCGMNWPPIIKPTYDYLARSDVRKALHVDEVKKPEAWIECSHRVGGALKENNPQSSKIHIPELLRKGVKVMLFAGDQDLICNHIGVERIPRHLDWEGAASWEGEATKKDWFVNNNKAGYWREARNLTYVSIAGGSHMVGFDKPVESHDMMLRFMGVDLMGAAGPSARIPSRVEGEPDRMLVVAPNPGKGDGSTDNRPMIPGVDGKTEEQVAEEAKWAAYYNAGSAALVVLLILVGVGALILLRLRKQSRRSTSMLGRGGRPVAREDTHELEHLVRDPASGEYADDEDKLDDEEAQSGLSSARKSPVGTRRAGNAVQEDQTVFDVGDSDDEGPTPRTANSSSVRRP
ncbi:kex1 protein [Ceraceosorus bombacis]|uniref:Carboxypeptidase n=1 Tax=Ceraceosorus bombacis TaxID=401625 RepID=A0A0P1BG02_9BASI|nr:kex1 protein [Ceraceosorus bombacis]